MKSNFAYIYKFLVVFIVLNCLDTCFGDNVKKSVDENRDDNGETNDEPSNESLDIPAEPNEQSVSTPTNITTCNRRQNSQMHEIKPATHRQFPFVASLMSFQDEHICSGTVVSNGLILTTAKCTQLPISYILLNATQGKRDETTAVLHVVKSELFPTFTSAAESDKNVGVIYTEKHNTSIATKVKLSDFKSTRNIVDMEVIGFGLNSDVGQIKKLQYIGLENRIAPLHLADVPDTLTGYIDCIDTKVPTCFKDTGGPTIFDNELIGVVTMGDDKCFKQLSSAYAVNKKVVNILPTFAFKAWLDEKIKKNEEQDITALPIYPNNPIRRQMTLKTSDAVAASHSARVSKIAMAITTFVLFPGLF